MSSWIFKVWKCQLAIGDFFQNDKALVNRHFITVSTINVKIEEASSPSPPPPQTGDTALHFMASQHPELSSHCRAEQQKQSLFLDMIYTYSLFSFYCEVPIYISLDINLSRWNIFSIDEIIFSLSLLHVAPGPAPGRRKLGGGRDQSVSRLQEASSSSHHHIAPPAQLSRAQLLQ